LQHFYDSITSSAINLVSIVSTRISIHSQIQHVATTALLSQMLDAERLKTAGMTFRVGQSESTLITQFNR